FNTTKGFGFIQPDSGGADVFVHYICRGTCRVEEPRRWPKVSYEVEQDRRTGKSSAGNLQAI
ncbi:MAG: cold-shock protein, partial [Mesorhizobium sp.]